MAKKMVKKIPKKKCNPISIEDDTIPVEDIVEVASEQKHLEISPYASDPIAIHVGQNGAIYYVSKHLLCSPNWSHIDPCGEISLPDISADTGHTLVHYLYTGRFQTLGLEVDGFASQAGYAFKQALLTYVTAVTYSLLGLEQLAKQHIEEHGACLEIVIIFKTIDEGFSKFGCYGWFCEYLEDRISKEFERDHTLFASDTFSDSLGKGSLNSFVMRYVAKLFSAKLTQTSQEKKQLFELVEEKGSVTCTEQDYSGGDNPQRCDDAPIDHLSLDFPAINCLAEELVDEELVGNTLETLFRSGTLSSKGRLEEWSEDDIESGGKDLDAIQEHFPNLGAADCLISIKQQKEDHFSQGRVCPTSKAEDGDALPQRVPKASSPHTDSGRQERLRIASKSLEFLEAGAKRAV
ncbi:hypothetical protein PMIN06_012783 [Paraphaeosphaeria minitans]